MIKVGNSKSCICTRKELCMLQDLYALEWCWIYELPLFNLKPTPLTCEEVHSSYVLLRPNNNEISEVFFNKINKIWNNLYEDNKNV